MRFEKMINLFRSQFVLFLAYMVSLGLFVFIQPSFRSWQFWVLLGIIFIVGSVHMWRNHVEAKESKAAWGTWNRRLQSLIDIKDIEDDGHLYEWFDESEWERIFSELEKMPKGSRSLRQAIRVVDPEFVK